MGGARAGIQLQSDSKAMAQRLLSNGERRSIVKQWENDSQTVAEQL